MRFDNDNVAANSQKGRLKTYIVDLCWFAIGSWQTPYCHTAWSSAVSAPNVPVENSVAMFFPAGYVYAYISLSLCICW